MVIRAEKNGNYTTISNIHLRDSRLSLKAKGLLTIILSLPNNWKFSVNGIITICKEEKRAVMTAIEELKENKYLVVNKLPPQKGNNKFSYEYVFYEEPQNVDLQNVDVQNVGIQVVDLQNAPQLNTNILNTNKLNTEELNTENIKKYNKKDFEDFWKLYPKRKSKSKTEEWFVKNTPDEELMKTILQKLKLFIKTKEWKKEEGKFIPYPTTWLNQKRWEDEISEDELELDDDEITALVEQQLREEGFYDNR